MYTFIAIILVIIAFIAYREYQFRKLNKRQLIDLLRSYNRLKYGYNTKKFDKVINKIERRINDIS